MTGSDEDPGTGAESDAEEDEGKETYGRSLRGGADRALERKRKQEAERERKEQAAKQPKGSKQYQRVLKKIDEEKAKIETHEAEIASLDNDLREADCPRTRVLGKDRFWNRYYWFERNAMPYEGLPTSSTAAANYANGRLWVQGPDDMEREGFIDVPEDRRKEYVKQFHMSVAERKRAEEGSTSVSSAREWGYYDSPESLDELIAWLDTRGVRETKLRKELQLQRDVIVKYMKNRAAYLSPEAAEQQQRGSTESEDQEQQQPVRMSTRTKTQTQAEEHRKQHQQRRFLKWRNLTALRENGHLHVDAARPTKRAKKTAAAATLDETAPMTNRQGKPLGRQGTRYNF